MKLIFGVAAYVAGVLAFLYLIRFVGRPPVGIEPEHAVFQNLGLVLLFGAQHSIMARAWWKKLVPRELERSLYVAASSAVLFLIYQYWQPMPALVWDLKQAWIALALEATYWIGWAIVLISAASMDHAELFGLKQTLQFQKGQPITEQPFREPPAYTLVRHPMMLGMIVAFWSTPVMSEGRLLFAAAFTVYILVAIRWEEKDLRERHGDAYIEYAKRVPAFIPWPKP